jgi:hypothetical protein
MADVKKCRVNTGEKDGGPGRDRTDDLFHAMEARSQLRHRPTLVDSSPLSSKNPKIIVADMNYSVNVAFFYSFPQAGLT